MNTVAIRTDYQMLSVSELHESPGNPRQSFDPNALKELALSIQSEGVQVPLIVRAFDGKGFELIAGHRRLRAAQIAGVTELPCVIRDLNNEEARTARILENLLREDLQPLEEAEAYQKMFAAAEAENRNLTPAELGAKIGKPEKYVRLRLRLLTAVPAVQDALRKQHIPLGHALELARLDASLQKDLLKFCLFEEWGSKRKSVASLAQLREHIAEDVMLALAAAPFNTGDVGLVPEAGACTDCKHRTGNDRTLFSDIKQRDICTLPSCFHAKVTRLIDITLEDLKATNKPAVKLSVAYGRTAHTPKDVLIAGQYQVVSNGKHCEDSKVGVYVEGSQRAKQVTVCTNGKCPVHTYVAAVSASSNADKEARAKVRKEAAVRARIFAAIHAAQQDVELEDKDYRALAEYALTRADHNGLMKLAKLLEWPKDLFGYEGKAKLRAKLNEIDLEVAVTIALLASVSHELSVNTYNSGKAERLEALAKSFAVNTAAIRKEVEGQFPAPASKPPIAAKQAAPTAKERAAKKGK